MRNIYIYIKKGGAHWLNAPHDSRQKGGQRRKGVNPRG
jgi:hypothetical protein